jgi:hypothetical protein
MEKGESYESEGAGEGKKSDKKECIGYRKRQVSEGKDGVIGKEGLYV